MAGTRNRAKLASAIRKRATYLETAAEAGDEGAVIANATRIIEYAARTLGATASAVAAAPASDDASSASSDLSITDLRAIAENPAWGILNAIGFKPDRYVSYGADGSVTVAALSPADVIAAADEQQERELALLGFFGQPGLYPEVDYSLFEQYYRPIFGREGSWEPIESGVNAWNDYRSRS